MESAISNFPSTFAESPAIVNRVTGAAPLPPASCVCGTGVFFPPSIDASFAVRRSRRLPTHTNVLQRIENYRFTTSSIVSERVSNNGACTPHGARLPNGPPSRGAFTVGELARLPASLEGSAAGVEVTCGRRQACGDAVDPWTSRRLEAACSVGGWLE